MSALNSPSSKERNQKTSRGLKMKKDFVNIDQEFYTRSLSFFVSLYDTPSIVEFNTFPEIQEHVITEKSPESSLSDLMDLSEFDFDSIIIDQRLKTSHKQDLIKIKKTNESLLKIVDCFDKEIQASFNTNPSSSN